MQAYGMISPMCIEKSDLEREALHITCMRAEFEAESSQFEVSIL